MLAEDPGLLGQKRRTSLLTAQQTARASARLSQSLPQILRADAAGPRGMPVCASGCIIEEEP